MPLRDKDLRRGYSTIGTPGFGVVGSGRRGERTRADIMRAREAARAAKSRPKRKRPTSGGFKPATGGFKGKATGGFR